MAAGRLQTLIARSTATAAWLLYGAPLERLAKGADAMRRRCNNAVGVLPDLRSLQASS